MIELMERNLPAFEDYIAKWTVELERIVPIGAELLFDAICYTLCSGGQRFRPALIFAVAEALEEDPKEAFPFALAIELVHTYSLMYDDLPSMDNDDMRRGQASNHIKYGESTTLLAGNILLTQACYCVTNGYRDCPKLMQKLLDRIILRSGLSGLMGGQYLDLEYKKVCRSVGSDIMNLPLKEDKKDLIIRQFFLLRALKTGALMEAAIVGAGDIYNVSAKIKKALTPFALNTGLLYQLSDDLQDEDVGWDSKEEIAQQMRAHVDLASDHLEDLHLPNPMPFLELIKWNIDRAQAFTTKALKRRKATQGRARIISAGFCDIMVGKRHKCWCVALWYNMKHQYIASLSP